MRDCREKGRGEGNRVTGRESGTRRDVEEAERETVYRRKRVLCYFTDNWLFMCIRVCVRACTAAVVCSALLWFLSHPQSHTAASMHDWWSQLTPASPGLSVLSEEPPGLIAKGTLEMNHERNERQPNRREESVLDSDNKENRNKHIA